MRKVKKSLAVVLLIASVLFLILYAMCNDRISKSTYKRYQPTSNGCVSSTAISKFKTLCKNTVEENVNIEIEDSYIFVSDSQRITGFFYVVKTTNNKYYMYQILGTDYGHLLYDGNYAFPTDLTFKDNFLGGALIAK